METPIGPPLSCVRTAALLPLVAVVVLAGLLSPSRATAATIDQKLETIVFAEIAFEKAEMKGVLAYLRQEAKRRDPEGKGVNFLLKLDQRPDAAWRTKEITLELTNIPLGAVLRYVCMAAGLHCKTDDRVVMIGDHTMPPGKMGTRSYNLRPGMLRQMRTRKKRRLKGLDGDR